MPSIPESVKISLGRSLIDHARRSWPQLVDVRVRYRGEYAYVEGELTDGDVLSLIRLGYTGSEDEWEFYLYRASADTYDVGVPAGGEIDISGTPEHGLDSACVIYLTDEFLPS
jgi:hypothetical protein